MLSHLLLLIGLYIAVSFNLFFFLLHLFIELILLPHLIIQVKHWLAYFLLLIVFYYVSRLTFCRCVTLVSHFCHIFVTFLSPSVTLYKREGV